MNLQFAPGIFVLGNHGFETVEEHRASGSCTWATLGQTFHTQYKPLPSKYQEALRKNIMGTGQLEQMLSHRNKI